MMLCRWDKSILNKTWTCRTNVSFYPLEIRKTALHGREVGRSILFEERSEKLKVNTGSSVLFLTCKPSPSRSVRQLYSKLLLCTRLWRYRGSKSKSTLHRSEKLSIRKGNSVGLCKSREGKVFQKMKGENQVSVFFKDRKELERPFQWFLSCGFWLLIEAGGSSVWKE